MIRFSMRSHGGHQAREGDDAEVMSPTGAPSREAAFWNALIPGREIISALLFRPRFIHTQAASYRKSLHRPTDDAHRFSLLRQLESLLGTDTFAFHSCIYTFRIGAQVRSDKAEIVLIAHHCIRFL